MSAKMVRVALILLIALSMIFLSSVRASAQPQEMEQNLKRVFQTGSLYEQPIDPNGKLLLSSRLDPDGSDYDEFIWDDFLLPAGGTITAIDWYGGYDPLKFGKGGPVMDFTVRIYPSIAAGTEPAIANPPLVEYQTGGNANETAFGTVNGAQINVYSFILPVPFEASANIKYWVFIVASQTGLIPDWCFISGTGGSGYRYIKTSGAGGDTMYRFMPGDAAFELLGQVPDPMTPTPTVTVTSSPSNTPAPTMTPTNTPPTPTPVPQIPTCFNSIAILLMLAVFLPGFPLAKRRDTNK